MTALSKNISRKTFLFLLTLMIVLVSVMSVGAPLALAAEDERTVYEFGYFKYTVDDNSVCITEYTGEGGDVSIPNLINDMSVVAIGEEAFWYRSDVTAIDLPDYLEYIGKRAFQGCSALEAIVIPDTVIEISDAAFCDCSSLTVLNIPAELRYVGGAAFDNTPWITRFEDNTSIIFGGRAYYKYLGDAKAVTIPKGVTGISSNAFEGNNTIEYVSIPDSVVFIGDYCFLDCPLLKSVSIPDKVYYMGAYSFGYNDINIKDGEKITEGFVLYADKDSLGEKYAAEFGIECKPRSEHATPDELPEAEKCVAKELKVTKTEEKEKGELKKGGNRGTAVVLIAVSCVVIIGGVYAYFTISDKKKQKAKKDALAARKKSRSNSKSYDKNKNNK